MKVTEDKIEIQIPFHGFYESIHSENIDRMIEDGFNYNYDTGDEQEVPDAVWEADVDYDAIHKEYSKEYTEMFGKLFGLDLKFKELTSPREYNFSTDKIFASIPKEQLAKLRAEVEAHPKWAERVKERFTSYDGFMSFYSNDSKNEEWTRDVLDECQYEVMLDFWIEHISGENEDWQLYLMDDYIGSMELDSIGVAHQVIEEQIKKDEVKEAVNDINKAIDWINNEYVGEYNMPTYAYEAVQEMKSAVKKLVS